MTLLPPENEPTGTHRGESETVVAELLLEPENEAAGAEETAKPPKPRVTPMNRTVWIMAIVAVLALGAGILLSRFVISPAQAAADTEPPEAGAITVPVELRALSSDVVARGDAKYDDAVEVTLETGDLGGPAVVTGGVPEVGTELNAGSIALEIAGRPVIVLPGDLPVYRTLRVGVSGPDVAQLRAALNSMGIAAGEGDAYDANLASAVQALYARVGYPAPLAPEGDREALTAAQEGVTSAEKDLADAETALRTAGVGATNAERIAQDNLVNAAQRELDAARVCANAPTTYDPETGAALPKEPCSMSVIAAQEALNLAAAQRTEALKAPDTSAAVAARDSAASRLTTARTTLTEAQAAVLTPFPASEVVYVASLPRRVDAVTVKRGSTVSGAVMTISGATLEIVSSLDGADAALLTVGMPVEITAGDAVLPGSITEIRAPSDAAAGAGRMEVVITPGEITEEQRALLAGTNVRLRIPVSSTSGEVLAVPIAALTAGAGGESRVEVMRKDATEPEIVVVTTGLSAGGYAEIVSSEAPLDKGDLVVVGE